MITIVTLLFFRYPILGVLSLMTTGVLVALTTSYLLGTVIFALGLMWGIIAKDNIFNNFTCCE